MHTVVIFRSFQPEYTQDSQYAHPIWLSDLSCAPCYWCFVMCKFWGNLTRSHMSDPMHQPMKKNYILLFSICPHFVETGFIDNNEWLIENRLIDLGGIGVIIRPHPVVTG